jgi:hypothetical protein
MSGFVIQEENTLSQRQRWSFYLTLFVGVAAFLFGANLRDSVLNATTLYVDSQAGIRAWYPKNWLIDTTGDYVFRVRDFRTTGFHTTIQVAIQPVSAENTSERNVLDALTLRRSQILPSYAIQSLEQYVLPDGVEAVRVNYTYVSSEVNPFLENVPEVVQGVDIVANQEGQALVISFQSGLTDYDRKFALFERFMQTLEY